MEPGNRDKTIPWLFAAAVAVRVAYVMAFPMPLALRVEGNPWSDARAYDTLAQEISRGHEYALDGSRAMYPCGYPIFVSSFYALFGERDWPVIAAHVLLSSLTVVLLYDVGRRIVPRGAALLASLIAIVHPDFLSRLGVVETEVFFTFALTLSLWLTVKRMPMLAGLAAGVVVLTRVPGLAPVACLGLWGLFAEPTWKRRLASTAIFAVACAAPLAPWAMRNARVIGSPTIGVSMGPWLLNMGTQDYKVDNEKLADFYWRDAEKSEGDRYRIQSQEAISRIRARPEGFLRLCYYRARRFWYPPLDFADLGRPIGFAAVGLALFLLGGAVVDRAGPWLACAFLAIFFASIWNTDPHLFGLQLPAAIAVVPAWLLWRRSWLAAAVALLASIPYVLTSVVYRYRFGTEAMLILFACSGAVWLAAAIRTKSWRPELPMDDGDRRSWTLLAPMIALGAIVIVGLGIVAYRQFVSPMPNAYAIGAAAVPKSSGDHLGLVDFESLTRDRQKKLGYVDAYVGREVEWIGVLRYPVPSEDFGRVGRFRPSEKFSAMFSLRLLEVEGRESLEPREVLVFSKSPPPPGAEHGARVFVRGRIAGVESHRGLVVEADEVEPWISGMRDR